MRLRICKLFLFFLQFFTNLVIVFSTWKFHFAYTTCEACNMECCKKIFGHIDFISFFISFIFHSQTHTHSFSLFFGPLTLYLSCVFFLFSFCSQHKMDKKCIFHLFSSNLSNDAEVFLLNWKKSKYSNHIFAFNIYK